MKNKKSIFCWLVGIILVLGVGNVFALSNGGGGSWTYRRAITINSFSELSDYQIKVVLSTSNFNYSNAQSDGGDLRFTDSNGTTELNYWLENWNTSGNSIFWVKVPNIPNGSKTIYIYYGNELATSSSNGDNTFIFFDDFVGTSLDTDKWSVDQTPTTTSYSISNSVITLECQSGGQNHVRIVHNWTPSVDSIIETKMEVEVCYRGGYECTKDDGNTIMEGSSCLGIYYTDANKFFFNDQWGTGAQTNTWYYGKYVVRGNYADGYWNGWSATNRPTTGLSTIGKLGLSVWRDDAGNPASKYHFDWVKIRKYTFSEPITNVGSEQLAENFFFTETTAKTNYGSNLIPNFSFEVGTDTDASNWTEGANHARSNDKAHTGSWSLKSTYTEAGTDTRQTISISPNTNYRLSGWIWNGTSSSGQSYLDMNDITGELTLNSTTKNQWEYVEGTWNSGSNTNLTIRCVTDSNPTGPIWFDDIGLEEIIVEIKIPFFDNFYFRERNINGSPFWSYIYGTWEIQQDSTTQNFYIQKNKEISEAISLTGNDEWTEYTFKATMKTNETGANSEDVGRLIFHYTLDGQYYYVLLDTNQNLKLYVYYGGAAYLLQNVSACGSPTQWHNYKIIISGDNPVNIKVYLDGYLKIDYSDNSYKLVQGKIGLSTQNSSASFDNIFIGEVKPEEDSFITVENGDFYLNGKKWYPLGTNYMPRSNLKYFVSGEDAWQLWLNPGRYDSEEIEKDLKIMESIGLNMCVIEYKDVSQKDNLVDFLERCARHDLKVLLSMRRFNPIVSLNYISEEEISALINGANLPSNKTVFAYDLGWEINLGKKDARNKWDEEWEKWIIERYGSIANAEQDWEYSYPATGPTDEQLSSDGSWRKMVCAYRRFVDDLVSKRVNYICNVIRKIDPNHLITIRQGYGGNGNPYVDDSFPIDLLSAAKHLDFLCPEGWYCQDTWNSVTKQDSRRGGFNTIYSRFVSNGKPVVYIEYGHYCPPNPAESCLLAAKDLYQWFFQMAMESKTNGMVSWWYPGGYRPIEETDYGLVAPDDRIRPAADVLSAYKVEFTSPKEIPSPDVYHEIDRDLCSQGYSKVYEIGSEWYLNAVKEGLSPGLKTEGSGTTSLNTPLKAVGNTSYNWHNPCKYLNAEFNYLEIENIEGEWIKVEDGANISVKYDQPICAHASIGNTAEAKWLTSLSAGGSTGTVCLQIKEENGETFLREIPNDTSFLEDVIFSSFSFCNGLIQQTTFVFQMLAKNRAEFGEEIYVILEPEPPSIEIEIDTGEYNFGELTPNSVVISTKEAVITNRSNIPVNYNLRCSSTSILVPVSTVPDSADEFRVLALFNSLQPATDTFSVSNDYLITENRSSTEEIFAGDQTGINVPIEDCRNLWFCLEAPAAVISTSTQTVIITITASP